MNPRDDSGTPEASCRAADLYRAELRPRPGGPLLHAARIAGAFVAELALQLLPAPDVHDVTVIRRADDAEVLRIPAGDPLLPGNVLRRVREELETLDPETFLAGWQPRSR